MLRFTKKSYLCRRKKIIQNSHNTYKPMDNNLKKKIDDIVSEISAINDLTHKVSILEYMEQQSSYMLWQLQDEIHIDYDSQNV